MAKIFYEDRYEGREVPKQHLAMIEIANRILESYEAQGYDLTVRGLYYKFVGKNLFPETRRWVRDGNRWVKHSTGTKNAEPNYKWLSTIINHARLLGLVDWDHLVDATRKLRALQTYEDAPSALKKLVGWYHIDFWENQKVRPEVWVEKDAQVGNMIGVCQSLDVPLFSCRGYTSQSSMQDEAMRLKRLKEEGYEVAIIYLGDHDPSGMDMGRDIERRINLFMDGGLQFNRIALNMDQVQAQNLPPDPAKVSDKRSKKYIKKFGDESWEMDALEPAFINDRIKETILALRNEKQWKADKKRCDKAKAQLGEISKNYPDAVRFLKNRDDVNLFLRHRKDVIAKLRKLDK